MAWVDKKKCVGCSACLNICPVNAISMIDGKAFIAESSCFNCGKCVSFCPHEAIYFEAITVQKSSLIPQAQKFPAAADTKYDITAKKQENVIKYNKLGTSFFSLCRTLKLFLNWGMEQIQKTGREFDRGMGKGGGRGLGKGLRCGRGLGRGGRGRK